jgi:hypothetical protein
MLAAANSARLPFTFERAVAVTAGDRSIGLRPSA